jgi:hypothetical protein
MSREFAALCEVASSVYQNLPRTIRSLGASFLRMDDVADELRVHIYSGPAYWA